MSGLDDVIAAETTLSEVDGANGRLVICGYRLDELAGSKSYEEVLALLAGEVLPRGAALKTRLGMARLRAFAEVAWLDEAILALSITEGLRALMARLPDGEDADTALLLVAAPAVFVPALVRRRKSVV